MQKSGNTAFGGEGECKNPCFKPYCKIGQNNAGEVLSDVNYQSSLYEIMEKIKMTDFEEVRMPGSLVPYYATKTEDGGEICIEPLVDQTFYVARYDEHQNLVGQKLQTKSNYLPNSVPEAVDLANELL